MIKRILKNARGIHMMVKNLLSSSHNKKKKKNTFKKTKQGKTKVEKDKTTG